MILEAPHTARAPGRLVDTCLPASVVETKRMLVFFIGSSPALFNSFTNITLDSSLVSVDLNGTNPIA